MLSIGAPVVWVTGLSGAGKTTVTRELRRLLLEAGTRPVLLDGDKLRGTLPVPPGHTLAERLGLGRFYGALAREFAEQGHPVLVATMSMFDEVRAWNRAEIPGYFEVWLRVPLAELVERDTKGVYAAGELVVGRDLPADLPSSPDLIIDNHGSTDAAQAAARILDELIRETVR